MGMDYILVNQTLSEKITFTHLNGSKPRELAGGHAQSAVVTWYLLQNSGDEIQFVSDSDVDWPFNSGKKKDVKNYVDATDRIVRSLIENGILEDQGFIYQDSEDPDLGYIRKLVNVWQR